MPGYKNKYLKDYVIEHVYSKNDNSHERKIAFLGLICHYPELYRTDAFSGAAPSIVKIADSVEYWYKELHQKSDLIIPMTHQDIGDDRELAKTERFPLILAAHDHTPFYEEYKDSKLIEVSVDAKNAGSKLIKVGMDAEKAGVINIVWENKETKVPNITVDLVPVRQGRLPDRDVLKEIEKHTAKLKAMEMAVLYSYPRKEQGEPILSSEGTRHWQTTMCTLLCTTCRDNMKVDVVLMNGGAIRGNKKYPEGRLTFSDIRKEFPFTTGLTVLKIPGKILSEVVQFSRQKEGIEEPGYLQADEGLVVDKDTHAVTHVKHEPIDPEKIYDLGIPSVIAEGMNNIEPLVKWVNEYQRVRPEPRDVKSLLMAEFSKKLWEKLPDFDEIDTDKSGSLSYDEVINAYEKVFDLDFNGDGTVDEKEKEAANLVIGQMMKAMDIDSSSGISRQEYYGLVGYKIK